MSFAIPAMVPEFEVTDLELSLAAYLGVFGFRCHVRRREDKFAYLIREAAHLMLEQAGGSGRSFCQAELLRPFGRGMNVQIAVSDVGSLYANVTASDLAVPIALEERWYRHDAVAWGQRQFVVADPDGYLLRFYQSLGSRPA